MDVKQYRRFHYQIKYKKELNLIDESNATKVNIANHFARNGYDNLYLLRNDKLTSIVTFEDFIKGERVQGLERDFVQETRMLYEKKEIEKFFIDNPDIDRISIVDNDELVCEIDSMIELPLQNGIAKNLMAIRYIDFLKTELKNYLEQYGNILLIADDAILEYFSNNFVEINFENLNDIEILLNNDLYKNYDLIIDFIYCSSIRKILRFEPENLVSMAKIITGLALRKLEAYCQEKGVHILFYKIPEYNKLTCLSDDEYFNCINRVKTGKLLKDSSYLKKYETTDNEKKMLLNRVYHASYRLDDGYCFIQDNCNNPFLHVYKGIRKSGTYIDIADKNPCLNFYGPCTMYGFLVPDENTIPAFIQKYALENGVTAISSNHAGIHGYNELNSIISALNTPVKKGDFMIFFDTLEDLEFSEYPNAVFTHDWFNNCKSRDSVWFLDFPGHCNSKANEIIAKHIIEDVQKILLHDKIKDIDTYRIPCIKKDFERFKSLKMTHSSCVRFLKKYEGYFFEKNLYSKIGVLILSDEYDSQQSTKFARIALESCDAVYLLKYNIDLDCVNKSKNLFNKTETFIMGKPVRIMQLDWFFYSARYFSTDICIKKCIDEIVFTERVLSKVILNELHVNIRFLEEENKNSELSKLIYQVSREEHMEVKYIR